ncbi:glycoside hydrolase family 6 protein [Streptomyces sp. NPDC008150]|uniref:glycoside hydrolase family 6 protein n=1 Tax=Streptomyces sp. NPDC008150 TaxID=3364816 RepID=UPI0036E8A03B
MTAVMALVLGAGLAVLAPGTAGAASDGHAISPSTRFFVPPPAKGSVQQIAQLAKKGALKDAALLARMEAQSSAVWLTGGTPAEVGKQVRTTLAEAALQRAEPVFVVYDIPGRDCSEYSAGGATDQAAYESWVDSVAAAVGNAHAVLLVEPDSLGNEPSDCHLPASTYPYTDAERSAEVAYAAQTLEKAPNAAVYLDGTNPHWQAVPNITARLLAAGVQGTQGFFLNVSNFRTDAESQDYGTWISDCIAMVTDPSHFAHGHPEYCASQYYPATVDDFSTWGLTTDWYNQNLNGAVPTTHFVVDTSRNGKGANTMAAYGAAPYDQSAATVATLMQGNWCNPTGAGLGVRPTADTGVPLLDANLWVKTPGQSDGQCDALGGVRAWDYSAYSRPDWPNDESGRAEFDPLWGQVDPAAGAWFPAQALQLARLATPKLG